MRNETRFREAWRAFDAGEPLTDWQLFWLERDAELLLDLLRRRGSRLAACVVAHDLERILGTTAARKGRVDDS